MSHHDEIRRALRAALAEAAAGWPIEAIQEALAAGRRCDRALREQALQAARQDSAAPFDPANQM